MEGTSLQSPKTISAEEVRSEAMPPQSSGVSSYDLTLYILEVEGHVLKTLGSLDTQNLEIRGIVRDIAAGRAMLKLFGTESQEGYNTSRALMKDAYDKLKTFKETTGVDPSQSTGQVRDDTVANITDELWNDSDFDFGYRHVRDPEWDVWHHG